MDATLARFGAIDIIVNNAGYTWDNVIQKTTDEQFQAMLDIHLVAPFRLLARRIGVAAGNRQARSAEGRRVMRKVVNITSIAATDGGPGQAGLRIGKGGRDRAHRACWPRNGAATTSTSIASASGLIETRLIQPLTPGIFASK